MDADREHRRNNNLLRLPQELLQFVLKDVPGKYVLRETCKAFSSALANSCDSILLRKSRLIRYGPRCEVAAAFAAFPRARRVVLSLNGAGAVKPLSEAPMRDLNQSCDDIDDLHAAVSVATEPGMPLCTSNYCGAAPATTVSVPSPSDEDLLLETIAELSSFSCAAASTDGCSGGGGGSGRITSLVILHLSCRPPPPSALGHLARSLLELELSDVSYSAALDHGSFNILLRGDRKEVCARGDCMVSLALSLPQLRRLSLASATFSVGAVSALGKLTQLESLSLAGVMECTSSAPLAQAAETHSALLASLRGLRQLRLPMAVASPQSALMDDDDDDDDDVDDDEYDDRLVGAAYRVGGADDSDGGHGHGMGGGDGGGAGLFSGLFRGGGGVSGISSEYFWRSSMFATLEGRWRGNVAPSPIHPLGAATGAVPGAPALVHRRSASGPTAKWPGSSVQFPTPTVPLLAARRPQMDCLVTGPAAFGGLALSARGRGRKLQSSQLARSFVFPADLQDLTIPLCALNRPVFEAVCDALGSAANGDDDVLCTLGASCVEPVCLDYPGHGCRSASTTAATSWRHDRGVGGGAAVTTAEGEEDFVVSRRSGGAIRAMAALRPGAPAGSCEHHAAPNARHPAAATQRSGIALGACCSSCRSGSCGSVGSAARFTGPAAARKGGALGGIRALSSCGGSALGGKKGQGGLRSLHVPTLAGYSHWEGSFLESARDFQLLGRLTRLELLHISLDTGALRMSRQGMRACFQNLRFLENLKELRVSEAAKPTFFTSRKRSLGRSDDFTAHLFTTAEPDMDPATAKAATHHDLCAAALQQLQRQWPKLHTLQFFSETAVHNGGGQLVVPCGIDDVELLPPPCACCSVPCMMAAPRSSVDPWGGGSTRWTKAG